MAKRQSVPSATLQKARKANAVGLQQYERWDIEEAIKSFNEAIKLNPEEPDYHLNLARAWAVTAISTRPSAPWGPTSATSRTGSWRNDSSSSLAREWTRSKLF